MTGSLFGSLATADATTRFATRHADRCLVLSHRLQQCITHAPQLEEELALANIGLDLLGQARVLYSFAADRAGSGATEDDLAFGRTADQFGNPQLVEQPNTDFAAVMVRQLLHDLWALELWTSLTTSSEQLFGDVAGKAVKETGYHVRHSSHWVVVLGDSTEVAHRRAQDALDALWPYVDELFSADSTTAQLVADGVVTDPSALRPAWDARIDAILTDATLQRPTSAPSTATRRPSSELATLIDEMQQLPRAFSGCAVVIADPTTVAGSVRDPELPELTLDDLGIVRRVVVQHGTVIVTITPTYTGCPATQFIAGQIQAALHDAGWPHVQVDTALSPAWTSDWITDHGRQTLQQMGIGQPSSMRDGFEQAVAAPVACPQCGSMRTRRVGMFGTSPCREPFVCGACSESFERIKPI